MEKSIMQQDPSQAMLGWANGPELSNWMRLPSSHPKQPAIPKGTKSKILGPGEKYERIKYVYNMCMYIYIHVEKDPKTECPWLSRNSDFQSPQRLYSLVALTTSPCNNCLVVWPEQLQTWQPSWAILWMRHPEIDDNTCFKEWTPA